MSCESSANKGLAIGVDYDGVLKKGPASITRAVGIVVESKVGKGRIMSSAIDSGLRLCYKIQPEVPGSYHGLKNLVEEARKSGRSVVVEIFSARPPKHQEITVSNLGKDGYLAFVDEVFCKGFYDVIGEKRRWVLKQLESGNDVFFVENDPRIAHAIADIGPWLSETDPKAVVYFLNRWPAMFNRNGNQSSGIIVPVRNFGEIIQDFKNRTTVG